MAGLGRVGDQEIIASCQQLRSVHMLGSVCPCQLKPWHIQAKVLLKEVFSWANNVWKGVRSLFFYELLRLWTSILNSDSSEKFECLSFIHWPAQMQCMQ